MTIVFSRLVIVCFCTGDYMNGTEYYNIQLKEIEKIRKLDVKPSMLLHSCCGPCNTYPMEYLSSFFDLTLYFNNHNIYPEEEYTRRYLELIRYVDWFKKENNVTIDVVKPSYDNDAYTSLLSHRADEKEGGTRCTMCFALRMNQAMKYASDHSIEYMTTVMTISRFKNSVVINEVGERLSKTYPNVKYFYSNFKKNDGYNKSIQISKDHNMYRQTYCGCQFSLTHKELVKKYKEDYK